jgi:hypothetical protein
MDAEAWRAAKGVLAEALACPPGEREAIVNARCADPQLRREVHAYLNEYDEHFLESVLSVSDTLDSTGGSGDAEQLPEINDGDRIGPYVVLSRLGAGGMGQVFLGNDTRLQRKVALKCLSASASPGDLRARILHEARAAARITHPNIAIVHDVVEHEDRPFLVMEYVEGENLAALIKRERPPVETIVTFVRQLASALAAAHGKGIVHRDLKPANIQVTPEGSVKILDFGVAHAMSAATMGSTTSSAAGLTVPMTTTTLQGDRRVMHPGTPAYMSPEQMFGRPIDQRSDIYSLGVIVYEMATGHRPYSTDDPLEVVLTLSKNFLSPGDADAGLPAQIDAVVSKMLAVKPDDRYQTAGELENALVALTARGPAMATALAPGRSRLRMMGRWALVIAAVPVMTGLLGFLMTEFFNLTLGRVAPFSNESIAVWLRVGRQSLVTTAVYIVAMLILAWATRFVVRLLSLSRRVELFLTTGRSRTERLSSRLGLDHPTGLAQAVATFGAVALAAVIWEFRDVILAYLTFLSTTPDIATRLHPLRPASTGRSELYRVAIDVLILVFALATIRVVQLRRRYPGRSDIGALSLVVLMLVAAVLMGQVPYRVMWQNKMERIAVAGERCYILGASGGDALVFCPERPVPRNRVININDSAAIRTGVIESIFTPPETSH